MNQNLRRFDLNLLLVFEALMQEQNLSRAAQRLHMSQPAVSNALARLRLQWDEPLFQRTARGMRPTPRAQQLYPTVREALQLLSQGLAPQPAFDGHQAHTFRLSMNDYAQACWLPTLLTQLRIHAPGVVLSVQPDDADTIPARLRSGELDLALDYLHYDDPQLSYAPLLDETLVVIARRGHPVFAGGLDVQGYQGSRHVTVLPRGGRGAPLEIVLGAAKVRRQVQLQVPHYLAIPALVASSDLLGTVPRRLAEQAQAVHQIDIAPLPVALPPIPVSMIWHRQQDAAPALHWLRQFISGGLGLA